HRFARDPVRLDEEGLDEECQPDRHHHDDDQFQQRVMAAPRNELAGAGGQPDLPSCSPPSGSSDSAFPDPSCAAASSESAAASGSSPSAGSASASGAASTPGSASPVVSASA